MIFKKSTLLLTSMAAIMTGCVEKDFDIFTLDKELSSDINLTLPNSSTAEIYLKNIMNLKEDGVVQIMPDPSNPKDSIFVVKQNGKADTSPVHINSITLSKPTVTDFNATVNIDEDFNFDDLFKKTSKKISVGVLGREIEIPDKTYTYNVKEGQASQKITGAKAENISADVIELQQVSFNEVKATLKLTINGFPTHIPYIHLDKMVLNLPSELEVSQCTIDGRPAEKITPGQIILTKDNAEGTDTRSPILLSMTFSSAKVGKPQSGSQFIFDGQKHTAELTGKIDIQGIFRIESLEMEQQEVKDIIERVLSTWTPEQIEQFIANPDLLKIPGLIPNSISFSGHTTFDKDLTLQTADGTFSHKIDKINPIKLNNLPDFLNDPEVVMDLKNPMLLLTINCSPSRSQTPTNTKFSTQLTLHSDNGVADPKGYTIYINDIPLGRDTTIVISDNDDYRYLDAQYDKAGKQIIPGLTNLISKIPKEITVTSTPVTILGDRLDITDTYDINVSYRLYAPLAFGQQFSLVYKHTERDFNFDDVKNIDFTRMQYIEINALATNTLPAQLTASVIPIDRDAQQIHVVQDIQTQVDANAKNQNITFFLKPQSPYTIEDLIKGNPGKGIKPINGITFRAELAHPVDDKAFSNKSNLRLTDIKITFKGQISYQP